MSGLITTETVTEAIDRHIREEVTKYVREEADKAAEAVRKLVNAEIDRIVLKLASEYSVYRDGRDLIIRVSKIEQPS